MSKPKEECKATNTEVGVRNIHQRLHAAMKKVDYVQKEEKKSGIQYRFVSHDAVTAAVRPVLVEEGVIYYPTNLQTKQDGNRTEAVFQVRFVNIDNPTDFIEVPTFGYGIDQQDKGPGKAISYGVKYALLKALGLETGDDPERDNLDHVSEKQQSQTTGKKAATDKTPADPFSGDSERRKAWLGAAKGEIETLNSPESIRKWQVQNEKFIAALGEKQHAWLMNDVIGKRSLEVSQAPLSDDEIPGDFSKPNEGVAA